MRGIVIVEFSEVMRQWHRMCEVKNDCEDCDISWTCPIHRYWDCDATDIEKGVMQWAADHPEPVYPTWEVYLADMMIRDIKDGKTPNPQSVEEYMQRTPIPADKAEKLGIAPKEEYRGNSRIYLSRNRQGL